ncbi:DUF1850 domain-containing protein [Haloparvum sp. AD34]
MGAPTDHRIVVESAEGEPLIVSDADGFVLEYTHSVEKTPVIETYERRGESLVMTRMEFSSYGAGLPSTADVNTTENDTFVFQPNDSTEELYVKPGRIAGHEIRFGSETYDLVALSDAETVRIYVTTRPTIFHTSSVWV